MAFHIAEDNAEVEDDTSAVAMMEGPLQGQPRAGVAVPLAKGAVEVRPVRGEVRPVRGEVRPERGEVRPVRGEARPVRGEVRPVRGEVLVEVLLVGRRGVVQTQMAPPAVEGTCWDKERNPALVLAEAW